MWILHYLFASMLFRIAGFLIFIIVYEIIRYLIIDKIRTIGTKIRNFFK